MSATTWYRVANLRPRVRAHAAVFRHRYRDRLWYVLQDRQTGRFFRLSPASNLILCLMDGIRTIDEVWHLAGDRLGPDRPSQRETLSLLAQLHQADLLSAGLPPDMAEMARRSRRQTRNPLLTLLRNPLAMRFALLNPDRFLRATLAVVRPALTWAGLLAWILLAGTGLLCVALHWPELTGGVSDRVFSAQNVVILVLIYPLVKTVHELAHAYATRRWGGAVNEMGIMLLVLFPVPYVDASASSGFADRWQRAGVAAAGVAAELAIAAAAAIAWTWLGPGLPRAVAYNVMLLCGATTLLFNANPLLRFDGYYVLSDLLDIPNLDARAKRYMLFLLQRFVLGNEAALSPVEARGEAPWLLGYGLASGAYRISVMLAIALLIASSYFVVGAALAALSIGQMLLLPAARGLLYLASSPSLRYRRRRAATGAAMAVLLVGVLLFAIPLPRATVAEGVVWIPEDATLRAGADGTVTRVFARPGVEVAPGDRLMQLDDPVAAARVGADRAATAVLEAQFLAVNVIDRAQAALVLGELDRARAHLATSKQRQEDLLLVAHRGGQFVVPDPTHLVGQFVREGAVLGYIVGAGDPSVHVVVPQAEIDDVRRQTTAVSLRFTERIGAAVAARIVRETPSALDRIPMPALSPDGGGPMLVDPTRDGHDRPLERFYEIDLQPEQALGLSRFGAHAYARFSHPAEPVAWRIWRGIRRVVLRRLET